MTFAPGTVGLDSATPTINAAQAQANGSRYRFRYSAGVGNSSSKSQGKLTQPGEIAAIVAAGSDFFANSEWYETRPTEGAAAGAADGRADLAFWQSRGLARGASIRVSWDSAPNVSQYGAVEAYLRAYQSALDGYYLGDALYAGIPALLWFARIGLIKHGWIPESSSWSFPVKSPLPPLYAPPARTNWDLWQPTPTQVAPAISYLTGMFAGSPIESVIWQDFNHRFGTSASTDPRAGSPLTDENLVLFGTRFGSHLEALHPAPTPEPPPIEEDDAMQPQILTVDKASSDAAGVDWPGSYLVTDLGITHIAPTAGATNNVAAYLGLKDVIQLTITYQELLNRLGGTVPLTPPTGGTP